MSARWTPGPWAVEEGGITGPDWACVAMPRDGHVYSEYTSDPATLEINNPADARLIAAAPEMADALQDALLFVDLVALQAKRDGDAGQQTEAEDTSSCIRALLAKIGGEA